MARVVSGFQAKMVGVTFINYADNPEFVHVDSSTGLKYTIYKTKMLEKMRQKYSYHLPSAVQDCSNMLQDRKTSQSSYSRTVSCS